MKIKAIWQVIKYPLLLLMFGMVVGCGTVKEVPIQTIEKVVIKDTTIYLKDTVTVEIPKEVIKEIVPQDTVSVLRTSLAESEAKIQQGMLHHSLKQTGKVKVKVDTVVRVQYVDRFINKEVPVEVVKEVKYIPDLYWYSLIFNVIVLCYIAFKIYLKIKAKQVV